MSRAHDGTNGARGQRPPWRRRLPGPASPAAVPDGAGRLARRAAAWAPRRPVGAAALLAAGWAAPVTLLGVAWGLLGGGRPTWDADRGVIVVRGVGGIPGWGLRHAGAAGATLGHAVLCRSTTPSATLLDHEAVHVRQFERLGPLFAVVYGWWLARHGYADNPLEVAARRQAARPKR